MMDKFVLRSSPHKIAMRVKMRHNMAMHHLLAAHRFSEQVRHIEKNNIGESLGSFWDEILGNSLAVSALTAAALESYANEIYFDDVIFRSSLSQSAIEDLARIIDRESVLRKFEIALSFSAGKNLDMGNAPSQNVDALFKLRNAVIHFKPEWLDQRGKHASLSKTLSHRFTPSTFFNNEPLFPRAWASHSFTAWAVKSTVDFIDYFYFELGRSSPIDLFRSKLSTSAPSPS